MRGPGLDTIHSALRLTAFDLPVDDSDLARACLLGAEVLGIQDPIGALDSVGCSSFIPRICTPGAPSLNLSLLVPSSRSGFRWWGLGLCTDGVENEGAHVRSRVTTDRGLGNK